MDLTCSAAVDAATVVVVAVVHVAAAAVEEHDTALLGSGAKVASSRQDGTIQHLSHYLNLLRGMARGSNSHPFLSQLRLSSLTQCL